MGVELIYNSVKTEVKLVAVRYRTELWARCGRESHIRLKGPWGPDDLRSREDADKMQ